MKCHEEWVDETNKGIRHWGMGGEWLGRCLWSYIPITLVSGEERTRRDIGFSDLFTDPVTPVSLYKQPTYPPTHLPTYLSTHSSAYSLTHLPVHLPIYLLIYLPTCLPIHLLILPSTYLSTHPSTYSSTNLPVHPSIYLLSHLPTNLPTHPST